MAEIEDDLRTMCVFKAALDTEVNVFMDRLVPLFAKTVTYYFAPEIQFVATDCLEFLVPFVGLEIGQVFESFSRIVCDVTDMEVVDHFLDIAIQFCETRDSKVLVDVLAELCVKCIEKGILRKEARLVSILFGLVADVSTFIPLLELFTDEFLPEKLIVCANFVSKLQTDPAMFSNVTTFVREHLTDSEPSIRGAAFEGLIALAKSNVLSQVEVNAMTVEITKVLCEEGFQEGEFRDSADLCVVAMSILFDGYPGLRHERGIIGPWVAGLPVRKRVGRKFPVVYEVFMGMICEGRVGVDAENLKHIVSVVGKGILHMVSEEVVKGMEVLLIRLYETNPGAVEDVLPSLSERTRAAIEGVFRECE
jgi:hypothetical protein